MIVGLEQDRDTVDSELNDLAEKLDFACDQYEDLPLKLTGEMEEVCNKLYAELKNKRDFDWVIFRLNHALGERSYCRPEFEAIYCPNWRCQRDRSFWCRLAVNSYLNSTDLIVSACLSCRSNCAKLYHFCIGLYLKQVEIR